MKKKEQIKNLKKLSEKYGVSWDLIDFEALVDDTLEYENIYKVGVLSDNKWKKYALLN